jgi:hypothetical protein
MRTILSIAAIAAILAVTPLQASAGVTCKSDNGTEQNRHSFTQGQCEATSDGSGAKATAHGNGPGSNGFATAQTLGVSNATAGAHSGATALSSDSGNAKAISDSRSLSTANAGVGRARAVSSSRGVASATAGGARSVAYASAKEGGNSDASAEGTDNGSATAISASDGAATANAFAPCTAKATASTKGVANASCGTAGNDVTAKATGGATAQGSDDAPPECDTGAGGTAKVTSPMGNCDN